MTTDVVILGGVLSEVFSPQYSTTWPISLSVRLISPRMSDQAQPFELKPVTEQKQDCMSCGSPLATAWSTSDGTAWLCRECANLHDLGCP